MLQFSVTVFGCSMSTNQSAISAVPTSGIFEFILILPVFLFLVLGMIDFGKIIYNKFTLQNDLNAIVELYQDRYLKETSA